MHRDKILESLKSYFDSVNYAELVMIFGSFLEDRVTNDSDLDIAVMFKQKPSFPQLSDISDTVSGMSGLKTDIVVLNSASPIIRMQILKKGIVLKDMGGKLYNEFYTRTVKEYDDLKRIRRDQEKNILRGKMYA